ncbi:MAG: hypothetical protein B9S38_01200 [Verrucomicrobiia bacterium Tous-C4TDCM]|nr:MAG: hypothetical protein B9S38_01200 [Verrucomicrobiae bacterium Tous-C4TDCM]
MAGVGGGVAGLGKREVGGRPQAGDRGAELVGGVADEVLLPFPDRRDAGQQEVETVGKTCQFGRQVLGDLESLVEPVAGVFLDLRVEQVDRPQ